MKIEPKMHLQWKKGKCKRKWKWRSNNLFTVQGFCATAAIFVNLTKLHLQYYMYVILQDEASKESSAQQDASSTSASASIAAAAAAATAGAGASAIGDAAEAGAEGAGKGEGQVGLGAAVALSQAASGAAEVDEETKIMIRQTAQWFHANPVKSKVCWGRGF